MLPPSSEYLAALLRRLPTTCARRVTSPLTRSGRSGRSTVSRCRRASIAGRVVSIARETTTATSTGSLCSLIFPWVMRDTSSRSPTRRVRCSVCRPITSRHQAISGSERSRRLISWTAFWIGASGLRSSWASIARNSSFRRSASRSVCSSRSRAAISVWSDSFVRARSAFASASVWFSRSSSRVFSAWSVLFARASSALARSRVSLSRCSARRLRWSSTRTATLLRRISGTTGDVHVVHRAELVALQPVELP